jgi:hypothetical protein
MRLYLGIEGGAINSGKDEVEGEEDDQTLPGFEVDRSYWLLRAGLLVAF